MADKPIREQSAMELLETHAKALEGYCMENARLREAIQWVVTDASYKPPEQINAIVTERWIARLRSALQSESRDG